MRGEFGGAHGCISPSWIRVKGHNLRQNRSEKPERGVVLDKEVGLHPSKAVDGLYTTLSSDINTKAGVVLR